MPKRRPDRTRPTHAIVENREFRAFAIVFAMISSHSALYEQAYPLPDIGGGLRGARAIDQRSPDLF